MKRVPHRRRARLKAWAYLALFGTDDGDDAGDTGPDTPGSRETTPDGLPDDGRTPEE